MTRRTLRLSDSQQEIWLATQTETDGTRYNIGEYIEIHGAIDVLFFKRTLAQIVQEADCLWANFAELSEGIRQLLVEPTRSMLFFDVSLEPDPHAAAELWMREKLEQNMDVEKDPLFGFALFRLAEDRFYCFQHYHHIVIDGFGGSLIAQRMADIYNALIAGEAISANPFGSVCSLLEEQASYRSSGRFEDDRRYWIEYLNGISEPVSLSIRNKQHIDSSSLAHNDSSVPVPHFFRHSITFSSATTDKLRAVARDRTMSWPQLVTAIVASYVHRLTGGQNLVLGLAVAARIGAASRRIPGMAANVLPIRLKIGTGANVISLADRVGKEIRSGLRHQRYRSEDIRRDLGMQHESQQLFNTVVNIMPFDYALQFAEARTTTHNLSLGPVHDLSIAVYDRGEVADIRIDFDGNALRYDAFELAEHARRFVDFVEACLEAPVSPLSQIEMITKKERENVLSVWNRFSQAGSLTISHLFELQVAKTPNAIALISGAEEFTYRDLNAWANCFAHLLIARNIGPEDIIGLAIPRSADFFAAMLGIAKAGAAYLPLDPNYPTERLSFMIQDAQPALVVVETDKISQLPPHISVLDLNNLVSEEILAQYSSENPCDATRKKQLESEHPAYVIYTSGSTGIPKGVMMTHQGIAHLAIAQIERFRLTPQSRVLQLASSNFDASVMEFLMAFTSGAALVVPDAGPLAGTALANALAEYEITHCLIPPTVLASVPVIDLPRFETLIVGGEMCSPELVARWSAGRTMVNAYGPTETTACVTMSEPLSGYRQPTIGRPIENACIYVLDTGLKLSPPGVVGEVYVSGPALARGYLNKSRLTSERFVADPLGPEGSRMYRTGDLARWRSDGSLEYLGRSDQQVKLRGLRIEPGEIEHRLLQYPGIEQAVVMMNEDRTEQKRLVGYFVSRHASPDSGAIRHFLLQTLPNHMVPDSLMQLASLPITPGGKLDRKALPKPDIRATAEVSFTPRNVREEILLSLFRDVLRIEHIGIQENFFESGGDSILSLQLVARARAGGLTFTHRDVFQYPTIEGLASIAQHINKDFAVPTGEGSGPVEATPITQWLLEQNNSFTYFNQSLLLQIPIRMTETQVLSSLQTLVDHHDALRLKVDLSKANSRELSISPTGEIQIRSCLHKVNVSGLDADAFHQCYGLELKKAALRLAPENGVMVQFVWFTSTEESSSRLLFVIHHLAVDGVSWRIIASDFATLANAMDKKVDVKLSRTSSFRQFAKYLNEESRRPERLEELSYWKENLKYPSLSIADGAPDPVVDTAANVSEFTVELPSSFTTLLLGPIPSAYHATVLDVLLAGFSLALVAWQRKRHGKNETGVLIDLENHGRSSLPDDLDLSNTVGWFTSVAPVRLDLGDFDLDDILHIGPEIDRILRSIKEQLHAAPDHGLGYGLLRYLNRETSPQLAGLAVPQIAFNYLGRFTATDHAGWGPAPVMNALQGSLDPAMPMTHLIELDSLVIEDSAGPKFKAIWRWVSRFIDEASVRELADLWFQMLEIMMQRSRDAASQGYSPSDFPLVSVTQTEIVRLERKYPDLEEILPLSPMQEGLLFHVLDDRNGGDVYMVQLAIGLTGRLNEAVLRTALQVLLLRHDTLRAGFEQEDLSQSVQCISRNLPLPWRMVDLSLHDEVDRETLLRSCMSEEYEKGFDLAKPPLLRFLLLRLTPTEHRLIFTHHHVLLDGWSMSVIIQELCALYANAGREEVLPPVVPYRNYLAWVRRSDRESAERCWTNELSGLEEPTRLAPSASLAHETIPLQLTVDLPLVLTQMLTGVCRALGVTLNTVVQGIWSVLLSRLTGRNDIVFGVTVSGRPPDIAGIETMVGLFIRTLPFRVKVNQSQTIAGFLSSLQDHSIQIMSYDSLGLADIQRLSGQGDLFDTLVVFENYPAREEPSTSDETALNINSVEWKDATHYPLCLSVLPGSQVRLRLQYHTGAFDSETIVRITDHLVHLFEQVVERRTASVGELELLRGDEKQTILVNWNDTAHHFRSDATLPDLFEEQTVRTLNATALISDGMHLTYEELDRRAEWLTHRLISRGVGPESIVGVSMVRSIEMVVSLMAILKAGAAYLPLDPEHPIDRVAFMIEDAAPALVLDHDMFKELENESSFASNLTRVDLRKDTIRRTLDVDHPAYVIYTSGSTGKPKGVAVSHRAIVNRLEWMQAEYRLQPDDRILQKTPFGFDVSVWEFFWPLLNGATLESRRLAVTVTLYIL